MRSRGLAAIGATCAVLLLASACGTDDEDSETTGGGADTASGTVKVGLLTPLSGPAAASYGEATRLGVEARLAAYEAEDGECAGLDFEIVEADDASSPQGALAGAQKLVQQDEVYAILENSPFFYGATPFITSQAQTVPVIGGAYDGAQEWSDTDDNMFQSFPVIDTAATYSYQGEYLESLGGTVFAGVSNSSPSSQASLDSVARSAEAVGLERGYINDTVPFGSTDVGAIVLGIMESGADVVYTPTNSDIAFAILDGLRQADYPLKGFVVPTGYSNALLQSEPAVAAAQGVSFQVFFSPVELGTPEGLRLQEAFQGEGLESGIPDFTQTIGYMNTDLFLYALEQSGCEATQTEVIETLQGATWDAGGLYPEPIDFSVALQDSLCVYYVKLEGEEFVPDENASPLCGERIED
ncbi:ABC transporter substrate-binding protein [Trujillonella endophytica]|uniref:Branched-chain amino acid transport system substrate-binding protein n=1 Tax=Trujillonella endophytica TaxID=673521 RepID=A0A1H8UR89_9ACTN|nr:ABC transporter substrate-binding protein [Trujillella endophytica]SEP05671.1 branched-chain amino acid transport system substrate-binding protein [Trujillella endophytica]